MSGTGTRNAPPTFASASARSIISRRSPAVNGFSQVYDSSAVPTPITSEAAGRSLRIFRTTSRCPPWNGWNRPMSKPRTVAPISLGGQILHVVQELVDVRATRREVVAAVRAVLVVPGGVEAQPRRLAGDQAAVTGLCGR